MWALKNSPRGFSVQTVDIEKKKKRKGTPPQKKKKNLPGDEITGEGTQNRVIDIQDDATGV